MWPNFLVSRINGSRSLSSPDALDYACTVCSAQPGQPCTDRQFRVIEPHWNRRRVAGEV